MKVMVTLNVETDLHIANGSRGEIVAIKHDQNEKPYSPNEDVVTLTEVPAYILVKMQNTKIAALPGLQEGVIPLLALERTFQIVDGKKKKTVTRKQLPVTPSYAFTDYWSQGQTINNAIVDIATPPCGGLTAFNIYVSLS